MNMASVVQSEPHAASAELSKRSLRTRNRNRPVYFSAALVLLALLTACSSDTKPAEPAKPEAKGPELITARSAFQKVYVSARGWNADAKPYRIESTVTTDGNGQDGKWAIWRGSFASAAKRSVKSFTWSGLIQSHLLTTNSN